jgi:LuxR family transcriptional regulator, activator of tox operons
MLEMFAKLGKVISSAGSECFASHMHDLLDESVPLGLTNITEWTVNETTGEIITVQLLGAFCRKPHDIQIGLPVGYLERNRADHPLSKKILCAYDTQLIHMYVPAPRDGTSGTGSGSRDMGFQCHLVSRKSNRRYVISLHRPLRQRDFSLQEMSFLKNFADTLLPLVEWHASTRRQFGHAQSDPCAPEGAVGESGLASLRLEFERRLKRAEVTLSARESEVCLGLLAGRTLREMASELGLKDSTVETYIKRAAIKLGISGRHGLAKWMIDDGFPNRPTGG